MEYIPGKTLFDLIYGNKPLSKFIQSFIGLLGDICMRLGHDQIRRIITGLLQALSVRIYAFLPL
jgi:hypothetical protein